MAFCETCGKSIEDGAVFCNACASNIDKEAIRSPPARVGEDPEDHAIFSFKGQRSSNWLRLARILPILIGIVFCVVGILPFIPNETDFIFHFSVLSTGNAFIGVLITFILMRHSRQHIAYFIAFDILLLTLGGAYFITESIPSFIPLGITLSCVFLLYPAIREKKHKLNLIFLLLIIILALGSGLTLFTYVNIILPVSFLLIGSVMIVKGF